MPTVYLLGAGFSRAISNEMPMMNALSAAVQAKVPGIPGSATAIAKNFEQWLSYLVDAPPWLSPGDQMRNHAAFSDVARAVHEVLDECQTSAVVHDSCPGWLPKLVRHWQATEATVITFNYDLLVELAWSIEVARGSFDETQLYPIPLTSIAARTGAVLGGSFPAAGLQLLKLHGSLDWRYTGPGSPPGDTIYSLGWGGGSHGWSLEGVLSQYDDADLLSADRDPMIVPPTAVKSGYYNNRTLRSLWMKAAEALATADELVLMGFSLPVTDLIVGSMLSTNLPDDAGIVPVDFGDAVVQRVVDVFGLNGVDDDRLVDTYAGLGEDAIPKWVERFANPGP
ncbi:hypothetical protein O6072_15905 [Mycolicibacterium neoaurum]|uniref:hypothetical protein n=1 Tax=Mycolicibacterium neoaurum TaxID=1795 RepID=UPI00248BC69B|nr:hypothetical protein [Mycolicibacterium neoaurum]WBP92801.1 hypothetical protein O7W24_16585 [Mycolicibacterium neoaurum]WBS06363.1 hypothetical protein O6072_15905 [Mycolicibacterium neoaurum]